MTERTFQFQLSFEWLHESFSIGSCHKSRLLPLDQIQYPLHTFDEPKVHEKKIQAWPFVRNPSGSKDICHEPLIIPEGDEGESNRRSHKENHQQASREWRGIGLIRAIKDFYGLLENV